MKITHVITTISRGGAENQLLVLVSEQIKLGHTVRVVPLKGALDLQKSFESLGAQVNLKLHNIGFLRQILMTHAGALGNADIYHAHLPQSEVLLAASRLNFVSTRHYGELFFPGHNVLLSRLIGSLVSRRADSVIAISQYVKKWMSNSREISRNTNVFVVPYGYPSTNLQSTQGNESKTLENECVTVAEFSIFARLSPEKNLSTAILAYALLIDSFEAGDQPRLKIYGEGPERYELTKLCQSLGLNPDQILMGRTDQPLEAMKKTSAIIVSSKFEGFGMVYLEAMSVGKPILASRIDTALEVLGTDGAAMFYETGNFQSLFELMSEWRMRLNPDYEQKQLDRLSIFSSTNMVRNISKIYETAIATKKS